MEIVFDPAFLLELGSKNPFEIIWIFFIEIGWIPFIIFSVWAAIAYRQIKIQDKFVAGFEFIYLAIDIPKASEQTPKAMEQVFATITGAHQDITKRDKYTKGEVQLTASFEIISIDGFVQFLVRCPRHWQDLIEGSIYAQYPDAEITEVEDYAKDMPSRFPNDRFNIWGSELVLVDNEALPIRTYRFFEDPLSQEIKDPLASMIENMSRIKKGEQVWFQLIIKPTENKVWVQRALRHAYKLAGKKQKSDTGKGVFAPVLDLLYRLPGWFSWFGSNPSSSSESENGLDFKILNLTPGERTTLEAIETKASKLGLICKMRLVYISPHNLFQSNRVVTSVFGAIKQFNDLTLNSIKPNSKTKTSAPTWFFLNYRKNARRYRIMRNYKNRSMTKGSKSYILNVEELATLYHFPSILVKSPMLKRTEVKKSDSPMQLPTYVEENAVFSDDLQSQLAHLRLDNDYYERRYAKNKPYHRPARDTAKAVQPSETPTAPDRAVGAPENLPTI